MLTATSMDRLPIGCPSCRAWLTVIVGPPKINPKPVKWICPSCDREHETDFGGTVLRIVRRYDD